MPKRITFAKPKKVKSLKDCYFYHTMDLPGYGVVKGDWDLRSNPEKYLGGANFKEKRVLEIGPASGYLTFYMESLGAKVTALELSDKNDWDMVPYARCDWLKRSKNRQRHLKKVNHSFWLAHKLFRSKTKIVYGSAYNIDDRLGSFDIAVLGTVLLHLRDPFLVLEKVSRVTKKTIIIVEPFWRRYLVMQALGKIIGPWIRFLPSYDHCTPDDGWWAFSTESIKRFVQTLGFEKTKTNYHLQLRHGKRKLFYTVVGSRNAQ